MKSFSILTLFIFILLPVKVFAHGENALQTVFIDAIVFFGLLVFIGFTNWKMNGKMRLLLALFVAEFSALMILGSLPYSENELLINVLSPILPITFVFAIFFKFKRKYAYSTAKICPPLIEATELQAFIHDDFVVLIDIRTGPNAKEAYEMNHLKGALFVDLDTDLAEIHENPAQGGRHPLPEIGKFTHFLGQLGISPEKRVIVYDDKSGANAAARFWWMLKALGHENVQVINGGLQAALLCDLPCSSGFEQAKHTGVYPAQHWILNRVTLSEVEKATHSDKQLIIDVRDADRYNGLTEPIDLIAGHIPTAINVPFTENLDAQGYFLPSTVLNEKYSRLCASIPSEQIIVHCGSGVTACHTLLAFAHAVLEIPTLYVGSWSEWSRNNKPITS